MNFTLTINGTDYGVQPYDLCQRVIDRAIAANVRIEALISGDTMAYAISDGGLPQSPETWGLIQATATKVTPFTPSGNVPAGG